MSATKPLIYSVDDDASMNQVMTARFRKFGCEIETFTEAHAVLEAIRKRRPALLLVDLDLGAGLSGFDVIESVRVGLRFDFPIVVVSSESESSKVAHALEIGATDFVVKPPFRLQFEEKVAEYIQTEQLATPTPIALRGIDVEFQAARITFPSIVREVSPVGFTLLSAHLIRKGSVLTVSGKVIKDVVPSAESVLVTVLGSATRMRGEERLYEIRVEVDPTETDVVQDIRAFLNRAKAGS